MSLSVTRAAKKAASELLGQTNRARYSQVDVKKIAAALNIDVIEGEFRVENGKDVSGLIKMSGKNGRPVIAVNTKEKPQRKRFTIAHEIGHFMLHGNEQLHIDQDFEFAAFRDSTSSLATSLKEIQANQFAAELLMPSDEIQEIIRSNFPKKDITEIINEISKTYNVSSLAATIKISALLGNA
ncbi:MAG: ImmA/IrrE family metallo-endopeptidase [Patescibacteria group bacterium]|nr:ImmA/IrrE family metallo-endopeptidase [Patescibacteria group bacterium]